MAIFAAQDEITAITLPVEREDRERGSVWHARNIAPLIVDAQRRNGEGPSDE
jgi:hypothetical protein